mgnify:CR=1 FL=1
MPSLRSSASELRRISSCSLSSEVLIGSIAIKPLNTAAKGRNFPLVFKNFYLRFCFLVFRAIRAGRNMVIGSVLSVQFVEPIADVEHEVAAGSLGPAVGDVVGHDACGEVVGLVQQIMNREVDVQLSFLEKFVTDRQIQHVRIDISVRIRKVVVKRIVVIGRCVEPFEKVDAGKQIDALIDCIVVCFAGVGRVVVRRVASDAELVDGGFVAVQSDVEARCDPVVDVEGFSDV